MDAELDSGSGAVLSYQPPRNFFSGTVSYYDTTKQILAASFCLQPQIRRSSLFILMVKRKRQSGARGDSNVQPSHQKKTKAEPSNASSILGSEETIQIVVGSYDQVLHGLTATIDKQGSEASFADTFLFNAHSSAIRCVAVSPISAKIPGQTQKVLLATGSTDERVHVYNLSAHPPSRKSQDVLASVAPRPILENPKNKELGTLLHHSSTITALRFPTRSKLLSSSDDSTIAVTRTRDWSMLSSIKAPKPKALGRPSGDTAPFGGTPSGVNDFAIHPSMKLMISVSKGERCMRLWNLVTGKKAGVLGFTRSMLQGVGESKHSTGEGRRVVWGQVDGADEFAIGFERGVLVFGMDSVPKCKVLPSPRTKLHQFSYVPFGDDSSSSVLAVSTEDGRIIFFSTKTTDIVKPEQEETEDVLDSAKFIGEVGGRNGGVSGRIKDFSVIHSESNTKAAYIVAASSDGKIRIWTISVEDLQKTPKKGSPFGKQVGLYETKNRITCLAAYLMVPKPDDAEESEDEAFDIETEGSESDDSD